MLLEKEHFDAWMSRMMEKLESIEKSCNAFGEKAEKASVNAGERLLDNEDLCRMLNVSKRSLQRYRTSGYLPYQMLYHKTFYKEPDVVRFIETKFSEFRRRREIQKSRKRQEGD